MRLSEALQPHFEAANEIVKGALDDYEKLYPPAAKIAHDPSCRAHIKQRHMLTRAFLYAAEHPETVKTFECNGLSGIICDQSFAFIFKKLDNELRSSNNTTDQIMNYRSQEDIPGIPAIYKLIAGYKEHDETGECMGVYVTRPRGYGNNWRIRIDDDAVEPTTTPLFEEQNELEEEVSITPRKAPAEVIEFKRGQDDGKNQS